MAVIETDADRTVRFERLVIDEPGATEIIEFHPRLTVIGVDRAERAETLAEEVRAALHDGRPGRHLEFRGPDGRSFVRVHARGDRIRLIDVGAATELDRHPTPDLVGTPGRNDRPGDAGFLRHALALTRLDGARLWPLAEELARLESLADTALAAAGLSRQEADAIWRERRAERHHRRAATALLGLSGLGASSLAAAAFLAGEAPLALGTAGVLTAVPLVALATRTRAGRTAPERAAPAGSDERAVLHALQPLRRAEDEWRRLGARCRARAALAHRREVELLGRAVAAVNRSRPLSGSSSDLTADSPAVGEIWEFVRQIIDLLDDPAPMVFDLDRRDLDEATSAAVLELLTELAAEHQVVVISADEDIVGWARLEAFARRAVLVRY